MGAAVSIKRCSPYLLIPILLFVCAQQALAAAWTQSKGHAQFITTLSSYASDHYFDLAGKRQSQTTYAKQEFSAYGEYGLEDWLTLGGTAFLVRAKHNGEDNWGLADTELFLRARLWQQEGWVVSAAPLVKLPGFAPRDHQPFIGSAKPGAGMQLSVGHGFEALGQHHFIALDGSYWHRTGVADDQLRLDATLGIGITPEVTLMPQLFLTRRAHTKGASAFTQSSGDDYDLLTARASVVYALEQNLSVQVGAYQDVSGKNAGAGTGAFVALWRNF